MALVCYAELGITMPLSKKKQAEYMREHRKSTRYNVIPKRGLPKGVIPKEDSVIPSVIPKYDKGIMYPDGRMRLEDMTVVQPNQVSSFSVFNYSKSRQAGKK